MSLDHRITDPNHMDYIPLMVEDDIIVVCTYVNDAAFQFYDYSIGQGSIYHYTSDAATRTITVKRSEQQDDEQLDDFNENFGDNPAPGGYDPDGEGDHGLVSCTITVTYTAKPEEN